MITPYEREYEVNKDVDAFYQRINNIFISNLRNQCCMASLLVPFLRICIVVIEYCLKPTEFHHGC